MIPVFCWFGMLARAQSVTDHQVPVPDTGWSVNLFRTVLNDHTGHLNGRVNTYRYPAARGNPYFGDGNWINGFLTLQERTYGDVNLRYDILNDWLLCLYYTPDGPVTIEANPAVVNRFELNGHIFNRIDPETSGIPLPGAGYYEILVSGKTPVFIQWKKFISLPSANQPAEYYQEKNLYAVKNGRLFRIINRKSILLVTEDREDDVKIFIRKHKISIRHSTDQEIAAVFKYYNSLY